MAPGCSQRVAQLGRLCFAMSHNASRRAWTEEEFFRWLERQEERYELVDGEPRTLPETGQRHNRLVSHLFGALFRRLRDDGCRCVLWNTALRIPGGNLRYPDVLVDEASYQPCDLAARNPVLVADVLSPSTRVFDDTWKLEEYPGVPMLRHILVLDPEEPRARLHSRGSEAEDWDWRLLRGEAAEVALPALGVALTLGECYGAERPA